MDPTAQNLYTISRAPEKVATRFAEREDRFWRLIAGLDVVAAKEETSLSLLIPKPIWSCAPMASKLRGWYLPDPLLREKNISASLASPW